MFEIKGRRIRLTRGDTAQIVIEADGLAFTDADRAVLAVKREADDRTALLEKTATPDENGVCVFRLENEDSEDIEPGAYMADAGGHGLLAVCAGRGARGLIPVLSAGMQGKCLRGDGTWQTPPNTTYSPATQSTNGLMTSADKKKLDGFGAASTYALKEDIVGMYKFKGSVAAYANLPTGAALGDVYNVTVGGKNYAWDGSAWDDLGGTFTVDAITNAEIDTVVAS